MGKPRFRFGLRTILIVVVLAAIFLASRFPPRHFHAADLDLGPFSQVAPPGMANSSADDHCIRIRSQAIINAAIDRHPEIRRLADGNATQWILRRVRVFPVDDKTIRVMALGSRDDKENMELVVNALAELYNEWWAARTGRPACELDYESGSAGLRFRSENMIEF